MVHELKKRIDDGKVFYGIKETLNNSKDLNKAMVPADCRDEIVSLLGDNQIDVEFMELSKEELANKLELEFKCEVFGLKK